MNELIENAKYFLQTYSFEIMLFIAGSFGAAYINHKEPKSLSRGQRWITYFFGGIVASFVTPLINEVLAAFFGFRMSERAMAGIGFITGVFGLKAVTFFFVRYLKNEETKDKGK